MASTPIVFSAELQTILEVERFVRGKIDRLENDIAGEEDAYLRQFPVGNLVQGAVGQALRRTMTVRATLSSSALRVGRVYRGACARKAQALGPNLLWQ